MLKALIKLPFKVALYPLKRALQAAGLVGREDGEGSPGARPAASPPPRPVASYEPPAEVSVPQGLEVQATSVLERVRGGAEVVLIDVRESGELRSSGMIEGALHIPLRDLPRRYSELQPESEIVLYCAAGMRSFDAAMFLRDKGFDRAHSLIGGLPGWTSGGGAIVPM